MSGFNLQGFNITAWSKTGFSNYSLNETALQYIKNEGSNLVTIDYAVNFNNNGTIIDPSSATSMAPISKDLAYVIDAAHQLGLQVILKPHITLAASAANVNDGNTSTNIFLASNFFPAWNSYLNSLGLLAQVHGVEGIAIGTEFNLYDSTNRSQWVEIISSLRSIYSGQLTYDALFSVFTNYDSTAKVSFWDKLDYISCSLYVPLSPNDAAPQSQLVSAFLNNPYGSVGNVVSYLADISAKYGKQIMALEGGYQSVTGALDLANLNTLPNNSQTISNSTQVNGLNAYLYALQAYGSTWLKGVSLWQVTPANMTTQNLSSIWHTNEFTSYQKPSAQTIADYFQGKVTYANNFLVAANGQKFYGGILNNSYEIVKPDSQPVTLSFNLTGTIINSQAPTIDLFINGNKVDTYHLNTTPSNYFGSSGINWDVPQIYSTQYSGPLNSIQLVFKANLSASSNEGAYIHGFSIDGLPQDLTKTIAISSGSRMSTDSMWYGTTSALDIGNRTNAIANGTEIHGGPGIDKVIFSSELSKYQKTSSSPAVITVTDISGNLGSPIKCIDTERLQFSDKNIALDLTPTQAAGQTALLLGAVLPGQLVYDASKQALVGSVIGLLDQGFTLGQLSGAILRLPVWDVLTGKAAPTTADIATYLVHNIYGGTETAAITNAAVAAMNAETSATQGNYLASLVASAANQTHINLVGIQATGLVYLG